jgi:hypothetical protein
MFFQTFLRFIYHFPFLILPLTKIMAKGIKTAINEIHKGLSTQIQGQLIKFINFKMTKTIVSTPTIPSPLFCLFLLIIGCRLDLKVISQ